MYIFCIETNLFRFQNVCWDMQLLFLSNVSLLFSCCPPFTYSTFLITSLPFNTLTPCPISSRRCCLKAVWRCVKLCAARCSSAASPSWRVWGPRCQLCSTCWWGTTTSTPRERHSYARTCRYSGVSVDVEEETDEPVIPLKAWPLFIHVKHSVNNKHNGL